MLQDKQKNLPHISVAPMMNWTDRHCRYFHRLISPNAKLYTEMITTGALIHGAAERFLRFDESEHYVALQLGGSNPEDLAIAAKMGQEAGYDEINLNCGCPSDRVQNGFFGACLMGNPELVAQCFTAMQNAVSIPVTIKCRIGIDDQDDYAFLENFVRINADAGCKTFIIHARKAWLSGLSPKENREIPPLLYDRVYKIKQDFPNLEIIINGGILNTKQTTEHLKHCDGVMIGREAYQNPYVLAEIEQEIFNNSNILTREEIAKKMTEYAARQKEKYDTPVKSITRHILGLYQNQIGAKAWRRHLSENAPLKDADHTVILDALSAIEKASLRQHENSLRSHNG